MKTKIFTLATPLAVKCEAGEQQLTVDNLRQLLYAAARDDGRFAAAPEGDEPKAALGVWVQDIMLDGDGAPVACVVSAADGKLYKVGFAFDGEDVQLADDAEEVKQRTEYVQASLASVCVGGVPVQCSAEDVAVQAMDGAVTGKPTFVQHLQRIHQAVQQAVEKDSRFKTGKHADGTPRQYPSNPYTVDVLIPDDDGKMHAVVSRDDGKLVRHGFALGDDYSVELDEGESTPTQSTTVYASRVAAHEAVQAALATSKVAVHCRAGSGVALEASKKWELDQPAELEWMPGGVHTISAGYGGRGIELTVKCNAKTAVTVQAAMEAMHAAEPNQKLFGCIEHREQEAAIYPTAFAWDEKTKAVRCTGLPSQLGVDNVNGRIFRSWSPSFLTDADYGKLECRDCGSPVYGSSKDRCECEGTCMVFPKGVRGSKENPAEVTGLTDSVGSLTNKPAFRSIRPVRAKKADVQPVQDKPVTAEEEGHPFHGNQYTSEELMVAHGEEAEKAEAKASKNEGDAKKAYRASAQAHVASQDAFASGEAPDHAAAAALHTRAASRLGKQDDAKGAKRHELMAAFHAKHAVRAKKVDVLPAQEAPKASEPKTNQTVAGVFAVLASKYPQKPQPVLAEDVLAKLAGKPDELTPSKIFAQLGGKQQRPPASAVAKQ